MGILLSTACNLNCKYCADLCNYRPKLFYKYEVFRNDFEIVLRSVNKIREVLIGGGEVMLYPDLDKVIRYCVESDKIDEVIIVTNGSIMPDSRVWDVLNNKKVLFRISGYKDEVIPNRKRLLDKVIEFGIRLDDLDGMIWYDVGDNRNRHRSSAQNEAVFNACMMKSCVTINATGKIFFCSREMAAYDSKWYPTPFPDEYIDVRKSNGGIREELDRFFKIKCLSTCSFCDGISFSSKEVPVAEQIADKRQIIEFINRLNDIFLDNNKDEYRNRVDDFLQFSSGYCFISHLEKDDYNSPNVIFISNSEVSEDCCYIRDDRLYDRLVNAVKIYHE